MLKILRFIFTGSWHSHTWGPVMQIPIQEYVDDPANYSLVKRLTKRAFQECQGCGAIRRVEE